MYDQNEQLHLVELTAKHASDLNRNMDLEILVRKKPFREDVQGGFHNDIDSDDGDEDKQKSNTFHTELLGGTGEDDVVEEDDTLGDGLLKRRALFQLSLDECQAIL